MIYGGTPYAFYMDNGMPSFSLKKWEQIVDNFYAKYKGLLAWQKANFKEVVSSNGVLVSPITHRIWKFSKYRGKDGAQYKWAEVCNYPVQGTSFDFIALWMALCNKELCKYPNVKLAMQVHDELVYDCSLEMVDIVAKTSMNIMLNLDKYIKSFFGYTCNIPFSCECKVGTSWGTCTKYTCNN